MIFKDSFFTDRVKIFNSGPTPYEKELNQLLNLCHEIVLLNKFSQRLNQNTFERSVVESCISSLERGRALSPAQLDQIMKMSRRKGPVWFCGHRKG